MTIRLVTQRDGKTLISANAKAGVKLDEVLEIAENEVMDGYADYSAVYVDGRIYAEYEG